MTKTAYLYKTNKEDQTIELLSTFDVLEVYPKSIIMGQLPFVSKIYCNISNGEFYSEENLLKSKTEE